MAFRLALEALFTQASMVHSSIMAMLSERLVLDIGDLLPCGNYFVAKLQR